MFKSQPPPNESHRSDTVTNYGPTDFNSIPVESIEQVELSSGTSSTLYGSEAFGGVVNITTKQGKEVPRLNAGVQYGSYDPLNYRASYGSSTGLLKFNFGYEQNQADNRYYRTGTLNSQAITARVEHQWQITPNNCN